MSTQAMHQRVRDFFTAIGAGDLPATLITEDFSAWTLSSGPADKQRFCGGVAMLAKIVVGGLTYDIKSIVAEDDKAVAEVSSDWELINGEHVRNQHVFLFSFDADRISYVSEYMDPVVPREKLGPLMFELMEKLK